MTLGQVAYIRSAASHFRGTTLSTQIQERPEILLLHVSVSSFAAWGTGLGQQCPGLSPSAAPLHLFSFAARKGATGEDTLAAVTAGGSRPSRTRGRGGPAFKVEQGHPMALAPSLLLASGERQTRGEVQAKAHLKDSSAPRSLFSSPFLVV